MRIIKKDESTKALSHIMSMLDIIESVPKDALGNSAEAINKMAQMYYDAAEIAYIVDGIEGLNLCIEFFNNRATTMDEIMAVSRAHLRVVSNVNKKKGGKKK